MDKYHITSERYELLFLYENIYGIFRPREFIRDYRKSKYYDLIKTAHLTFLFKFHRPLRRWNLLPHS